MSLHPASAWCWLLFVSPGSWAVELDLRDQLGPRRDSSVPLSLPSFYSLWLWLRVSWQPYLPLSFLSFPPPGGCGRQLLKVTPTTLAPCAVFWPRVWARLSHAFASSGSPCGMSHLRLGSLLGACFSFSHGPHLKDPRNMEVSFPSSPQMALQPGASSLRCPRTTPTSCPRQWARS